MTGSAGRHPASRPEIRIGAAPVDGGVAITVNGKPALTPGKHPLVVPGAALAAAIADELAETPRRLTGKGLSDPAAAPNFRIALGAIDLIAHNQDARAQTVDDLAAYGETDLVCFRGASPESLVQAQEASFDPLLAWFASTFGASLNVTTGLRAVPQDRAALAAIRHAISACDDFTLSALAFATRAAGSIVIGLALINGAIDAEDAYRASVVDEAHQAERWGEDADAARSRAGKALDLAQAARFVELLAMD